ncbi:hypothetical protein [Paenibacillus sp. Root444D2]|nr:hypothetical protein [Paenibacillus sp. Root444D2]
MGGLVETGGVTSGIAGAWWQIGGWGSTNGIAGAVVASRSD